MLRKYFIPKNVYCENENHSNKHSDKDNFFVALITGAVFFPVYAQKTGNVNIKLAVSETTVTIDGKIEATNGAMPKDSIIPAAAKFL